MRSHRLRRVILLLAAIGVIAPSVPVGLSYYHYFMSHVSTDDAYVDGTVTLVSSRVAGTVARLYVDDNWTVKKGTLLLTLDPRDFQVQVDHARAQLERSRQNVDELYEQVYAAQAGLRLAQSQLKQARIDYKRAKALRDSGVASEQYFDQASTAFRIAKSAVALARDQVAQARAALGGDTEDHARYDRPIVRQAKAALEAAALNLTYTRIFAPISGIVTRKSVHVGHHIQPGEPLMAIVPATDLYVIANFKETQLTNVRVGQRTEVEADIYPGYTYHGRVESISMGTGAAFSLLPPENATGNWVKVVQRVPVKIVLDSATPPDKPLRLGLSVEVSVDVSDTTGPLLSSLNQERSRRRRRVSQSNAGDGPAELAGEGLNDGPSSALATRPLIALPPNLRGPDH